MDDMKDAVPALRPVQAGDLESVIALDRSHSGQSRRGFFEKRWRAMAREPEAFISLAAEQENALLGFVLAHGLRGAYRPGPGVAAAGQSGRAQGGDRSHRSAMAGSRAPRVFESLRLRAGAAPVVLHGRRLSLVSPGALGSHAEPVLPHFVVGLDREQRRRVIRATRARNSRSSLTPFSGELLRRYALRSNFRQVGLAQAVALRHREAM